MGWGCMCGGGGWGGRERRREGKGRTGWGLGRGPALAGGKKIFKRKKRGEEDNTLPF